VTSTENGVPLTLLRRYHFGELDGAAKADVEARLERDPVARTRLERMRAGEAAYLAEVDVAAESVAVVERLARARPRTLDAILAFMRGRALQTAAALVLLVALVPLARIALEEERGPNSQAERAASRRRAKSGGPALPDRAPMNRTKGSAELQMFVRDPAGVKQGFDGMTLSAGDQIQFRYRAMGHRYLFVVSMDAKGTIAPLYPDAPSASIPIRPDGLQTLDGSVILDDGTGPERIFAVFSDEPMTYTALEQALRGERDPTTLKTLHLEREDVDQATILIRKE
jgi:hypothetical protein